MHRQSHPLSRKTAGLFRILPICALLAVSGAQAALINVDFNSSQGSLSPTYSGAAVLGAAGDTWNGVLAGSFNAGATPPINNLALVNSSGGATTASLSLSSNAGNWGGAPTTGCQLAAALLCDYLYANNKTVTLSIAGLAAGELFDLALYSIPSTASGRTSTFKLGNVTKAAATPAGVTPQNTVSFTENLNFVRYAGTVGTTGTLSFQLIGGSFSTEGNLNGFQLNLGSSQVPEPAGIGLVLLGLAAAVAHRRRCSHG